MLQHLSAAPRTLHLRRLHIFLYGLLLAVPLAQAASVPAGFNDRQVASGFRSPTSMGVLPDGRVLVVEQNGVIRLIKDDALQSASFYTVQNVDTFSERGCLGVTADPNFAVNRYVYLYCTVKIATDVSRNRVLRVTASGDLALPGSETTILELPDVPQGVQWHMGGPLRFGVDGKLYVGVGGHEDLRTSPLEASFSQNLASPFGKILRINPDGSFPSDNPYFNTAGAYRGIYMLGLRNPYSVDVQPNTGLLYVNDVGAGSVEEINRGVAGANYAWPIYEGRNNDPRFTNAIFEYGRTEGCAITGGSFYNPVGAQFPSGYVGKYLFSDYCSGWIRMIDPANPGAGAQEFATGISSPVGMGVAPDGSLYYLARQGADATIPAMLGKISFTGGQGPRLTLQPLAQTVFLGNPASFRVDADNATSYQWRRNGADIPGATAATYTIAQTTMADNGALFSVLVGNAQGSVESSTVALTVTTNSLPAPVISSPAVGTGFAPGDKIGFAGSATDAEDGALAASALSWKVDFMHDTHSHPFYPATSGIGSGEFTVPAFDAEAANIWLRLSLSATDSAGQTATVTRDIYPDTQLSGIAPIGTPLNGLGAMERNLSNGGAAQGDGEPIRLDGIAYAKGLGMHAPAEVQYDLAAACTGHLIADVGIDDAAGNSGSAIFQVFLDNEKVFDSGLMRGSDLRKAIYAGIAGKRNLRLVVSDGGDGNTSDLADWGGIRVTGCAPGIGQPIEPSGGAPIVPPVAAGGSGGGGCAIGGDGRFDPVLPGLLAVALGAIAWRRRRNGSPRP